MEENRYNQRRGPGRPTASVSRERVQRPSDRPRTPRTMTGSAASRAAERERRMQRRALEQTSAETEQIQGRLPRQSAGPADEGAQTRSRRRGTETEEKPRQIAHRADSETEHGPERGKKKTRRPRRIRNTNFKFKFLTMLAVVAVVILGLVIFFKVQHITVVGNKYYTAEEIIEASGIHLDDNLLSLSKANVSARIRENKYYVNEIQIKKKLPGTVVILISEFDVTYSIQDETGSWWLINREGRIMEKINAQDAQQHLQVLGVTIQQPKAGDPFKPTAADGADMAELAAKRTAVTELLPLLEKTALGKQIVSVDVSTSYDVRLQYGSQYTIKLGNTENLEDKLRFLQGVLEDLTTNKDKPASGTIDVSTVTNEEGRHASVQADP